jgi:hypothetical protein
MELLILARIKFFPLSLDRYAGTAKNRIKKNIHRKNSIHRKTFFKETFGLTFFCELFSVCIFPSKGK